MYVQEKYNTHIMTLIHIIFGSTKCNTYMNLKMHNVCGGKIQYPHHDLNPHYMWEP